MALVFSKPSFAITCETRSHVDAVLLYKIKIAILGKKYDLSVAFVSPKRGKDLHKKFKKTSDPLNIFSFPYSDTEGEIAMNLSAARSEAKNFGHTYTDHVAFLFVHGCVHLLGHDHGDAMEKIESKFLKRFKIPDPYLS